MNKKEIQEITDYIFLEPRPEKADLAIVFGTRHRQAVDKTFRLYQNKLVPKILISGGENRVTDDNEADKMSQELMSMGVQREDIILEDRSTNSLENVLFSKEVLEEKIGLQNLKKIIAVTKHYHSRRAIMTLRRHFPKTIKFIPAVYEVYGFTRDDWAGSESGREKVMSEYNKIKEYLAKGDIEEL